MKDLLTMIELFMDSMDLALLRMLEACNVNITFSENFKVTFGESNVKCDSK